MNYWRMKVKSKKQGLPNVNVFLRDLKLYKIIWMIWGKIVEKYFAFCYYVLNIFRQYDLKKKLQSCHKHVYQIYLWKFSNISSFPGLK